MDILLALPATVVVFLLGSAIGSFLNVVIYRIPAGLSLLYPPSRCPHCLHPLSAADNLPIVGWLWLKGRCRYCQARISWRYPCIEAVTGLLFVAIFWQFGVTGQTIGYWVLVSWLLALSLIDLDTFTLPNSLTQSGLVVGLIYQGVVGAPNPQPLMNGILGAVLGIWLLDGITFIGSLVLKQEAMGGGDAKLAAMMGAWLGWKCLLVAGFFACVCGAVVGGGAIALGLMSRRQPIPFGPFLAFGTLITLFWGETILSFYLQLFFPLT